MDPAQLRVVVASGEFRNVDDLIPDVVNGGSTRFLAVWALAMQRIDAHGRILHGCCLPMEYRRSPVDTAFSNQLICLWRLLR